MLQVDAAAVSTCYNAKAEVNELLQAYHEYLGLILKDSHDRWEYYKAVLHDLRSISEQKRRIPEHTDSAIQNPDYQG